MTALAMGADRAIRIDAPEPLDPWNVAGILAELARRLEPRLVLMGKQAVDDDSAQAGQFLAARLGWPGSFRRRPACLLPGTNDHFRRPNSVWGRHQ